MGILRNQWHFRPTRNLEIDPTLLTVRGARHYHENIERLLMGPVPRPREQLAASEKTQLNLKEDFCARLLPVISSRDALASSHPDLLNRYFMVDDKTHAHDPNAVGVHILAKDFPEREEYLKVGHISKLRAERVRRIVEPFAKRGRAVEFGCTIFWNGDPEAEFKFYSVQLFNVARENLVEL